MKMGNALVCLPQTLVCLPSSLPSASSIRQAPAQLVNAVTAQVVQVHDAERVQVAEVMLEHPGTFLMPLTLRPHLSAPARHNPTCTAYFEALPADHQLQHARTYLLLPMHKLHQRVSPQELAFLAHLAFHNTRTAPYKAGGSPPFLKSKGFGPKCESLSACPSAIAAASSPSSSCFLHMNQQEQPPNTGGLLGGHSQLFHRSKSWTPNLQTIREAPGHYAGYGKQLTRFWSKGHHLVSTY